MSDNTFFKQATCYLVRTSKAGVLITPCRWTREVAIERSKRTNLVVADDLLHACAIARNLAFFDASATIIVDYEASPSGKNCKLKVL